MDASNPASVPGYDPAAGPSQSAFAFTFICGSCGAQHHSLRCLRPEGWQFLPGGRQGEAAKLLCPDCQPGPDAPQQKAQPQPFALYLEKQPCGAFHIAMNPEDALMRWLPLGFFLTPEQARQMAHELHNLAALAERPGSVPSIARGAAR
ncbi:hypothetical protein [Altererythrobacter fulvus]|uniref:hypothetical protein n=1 Tax=Caenibius fulvus TaxID=2126012 RepID=UPI0030159729